MSLLTRLFRPHVELPPPLAGRLKAWQSIETGTAEHSPIDEARFVVVDVETSGLDPHRDRLLAIGAVAVEGVRLRPAQSYSVTLHNPAPSDRDNILVHGIGPDEQIGGMAPDASLMGFLELARRDVLVAFHADFDKTVLGRALRDQLGIRLPNPWIDLAWLAPALVRQRRHRGLDDWLAEFGLRAHVRHRAVFDAYATAELLLVLQSLARRQGLNTVGQLMAAAEAQRRLVAGSGGGGI